MAWVGWMLYSTNGTETMFCRILEGIVDEVLGTLNLLLMILWVMEGQIRGGYFPDYILDPSVIDCSDPE